MYSDSITKVAVASKLLLQDQTSVLVNKGHFQKKALLHSFPVIVYTQNHYIEKKYILTIGIYISVIHGAGWSTLDVT